MSNYEKELEALKYRKCEKCSGSGKIDDADLGDISFNQWCCPKCLGTGFKEK